MIIRACLVSLVFTCTSWSQLSTDPDKAPKTWQEDLLFMVGNSRAEPALRDTFEKLSKAARRGTPRKVTREYRYALFSIAGGIIGFRIGDDPSDSMIHSNILIGVQPGGNEPPAFPFAIPAKVGDVQLLARKSKGRPHPAVAEEDETYFGEKCTAYVYGAGHWITRYFVKNDRILAISFALEP